MIIMDDSRFVEQKLILDGDGYSALLMVPAEIAKNDKMLQAVKRAAVLACWERGIAVEAIDSDQDAESTHPVRDQRPLLKHSSSNFIME